MILRKALEGSSISIHKQKVLCETICFIQKIIESQVLMCQKYSLISNRVLIEKQDINCLPKPT